MTERTASGSLIALLLFCETCGTWTRHVVAGAKAVCGCGSEIAYHERKADE